MVTCEKLPYFIYYEPAYYSFRLYGVTLEEPDTLINMSEKGLMFEIYTVKGHL